MIKRGRPGVAFRGKQPNRIRDVRERRGVTQEELAKRIHTEFQSIGKLERGESRLRVDHLLPIARALECHPAELVPDILMLTPGQSEILRIFNSLPPDDQERALRMLSALCTPTKISA